jgi:peroxiredoxin
MKRLFCLGLLTLSVALLSAQTFKVGSPVSDFTVSDLNGSSVPFKSIKGDLTVVMFIATQCPISNAYNERMNALYKEYSPKGVKFLFINANNTEPASEVASHAAQHGFAFKVYKDPNNVVADQFGAEFTPEAFVIDKAGVIRYHGHIDDSRQLDRIKSKDLKVALDSLLAGQGVPVAETKAFGCTIKRVKKST